MAVGSTNRNQAKETGGNLDTITALLKSMETVAQTNRQILAELRVLNLNIATISGLHIGMEAPEFFIDN